MLDQGASAGPGHFSGIFFVESGSCEMLMCILTAQARTKCVFAFWAHSGLRHFTCKLLSNDIRGSLGLSCCQSHLRDFGSQSLINRLALHVFHARANSQKRIYMYKVLHSGFLRVSEQGYRVV